VASEATEAVGGKGLEDFSNLACCLGCALPLPHQYVESAVPVQIDHPRLNMVAWYSGEELLECGCMAQWRGVLL
jgi:hypothetical protein